MAHLSSELHRYHQETKIQSLMQPEAREVGSSQAQLDNQIINGNLRCEAQTQGESQLVQGLRKQVAAAFFFFMDFTGLF